MMASSKRNHLFKVLCVSLFSGTMGFAPLGHVAPNSGHHLTTSQQQIPTNNLAEDSFRPRDTSRLYMTTKATTTTGSSTRKSVKASKVFPERLTPEEESELLRQAVEFRRLSKLETDLTLKSTNRKLPLLSVRAKAAGYGDEILEYEDAMMDGQKAREALVTRNMGLVHYCVKQILNNRRNKKLNSLSYEDLVQEGAIGLARAVDRWNPEIGGRLSTYAVYWIRAAVFRCIAERDDLLRVPSHVTQAIRDVNKAARRLGIDLDAQETPSSSWQEANYAKKLAEEAGLSERNFDEAMKARSRRQSGGYVAFENWMQMGKDLQSDVPIPREEQNTSSIETEHLRVTLSQFLRPKEMEALSWRYGLVDEETASKVETPKEKANRYLAEVEQELFPTKTAKQPKVPARGRWGEAMTFTEVGNRMHVSAEYGRKLCHAALAKLKQAAEDGRLEPALLF